MNGLSKENIEYEGKRLGFVIRKVFNIEKREFPSPEEDFIQTGILNLKKGEWVAPHIHKPRNSIIDKTQKVIYVLSGKLKIYFYKDKKKIKEVDLNMGDLIVLLRGGFGFESLEDNTKIIEIKQGPYPGLEGDKEKFKPEG
jgi:mannose-6-phosphate isomerase-like protein (cupin superfamily)